MAIFKDKKTLKYTIRISLFLIAVICEKVFLNSYFLACLAILGFNIAIFINIKNQPVYFENHFKQLESLLSLFFTIKPDYPMPTTRGFAASPDLLKKISEVVLNRKPGLVVEASSGVSTLMIAYCLRRIGSGTVIALEHDGKYAEISRELLKTHGLDDIATVIHAPLSNVKIDGKDWLWYDTALIDTGGISIDLLIVDGPPNNVQEYARFPALPVLFDRLSKDCLIILDDVKRKDEQQAVEMWKNKFRFASLEFLNFEKGAAIIHIEK